jgi:hypothetical protein
MNVEELLAREEIRLVMSTYTMAGDRGRLDELVTAFTTDGVLEFNGQQHKGHEAIVRALTRVEPEGRAETRGSSEATPFVRHNLTSSRIELRSAVAAEAWTYFDVVTPIGFDHCGVYVDRFSKASGRWLIEHRRVKIDWRHPQSTMAPMPDRSRR